MRGRNWIGLIAAGSVAMAVGTAEAGLLDATIDISASNGFASNFMDSGTAFAGGFNFAGATGDADFDLTWDFNADNDLGNALITSGFTVQNNSDAALDFTIMVSIPLDGTLMPQTTYLGSGGFTLTGMDAEVSTLAGTDLWGVMIDGTTVDGVFNDPYSLAFAGSDSQSMSQAITPGVAGPASTVGIALNFTLSAGDIFTSTGAVGFQAIPAPGALAVFGGLALVGTRRRRG